MYCARYRLGISRIFGISMLILVLFCGRSLENLPGIADTVFFIGVTLVSLATMGRLWCSIYISGYKNNRLIQEGPYSISRNPLYFFNMLGGVGLGLATETLTIPVIIILGFVIYYPKAIRQEEKDLIERFGKGYEEYQHLTPCFFPNFSFYHATQEYTINTTVFSRELLHSFWFIFGLGFLELIETLQETGIIPIIIKIL